MCGAVCQMPWGERVKLSVELYHDVDALSE
jgi:hypothetical protein